MDTEKLYLNIINNLCDGVYFVNLDREIIFWNKAAENISGFSAEEMIGHRCHDNLLSHIDETGRPLCTISCPLYDTIIDGKQRKNNVFLRHKSGHRIPITINVFPIYEDNIIIGAVEIFTPASTRIYEDSMIEKLSDIAMQDMLTGLPNRRYLESYLDYRLSEFMRFHSSFALLYADVDHFRDFNTNFGHEVGDAVLKNIAKSIRAQLRQSDMFGRWGGEEFVGIYSVRNHCDLPIIGEKVRALVENTLVTTQDGRQYNATISVGITAVLPSDTKTSIINRADQLMYLSKSKGRNCISCD